MRSLQRSSWALAAALSVVPGACEDDDVADDRAPQWTEPADNVEIDGALVVPGTSQAIIRTAGDFTYIQLGWAANDPLMSASIAFRLSRVDVDASRPVRIDAPSVRLYAISARAPNLFTGSISQDQPPTGEVRAERLAGHEMRVGVRLDAVMSGAGSAVDIHIEGTLIGPEEGVSPMSAPCDGHDEPVFVPMMQDWSFDWLPWARSEAQCVNTAGVECGKTYFDLPCGARDRYYCDACHDTICVHSTFYSECLPTY